MQINVSAMHQAWCKAYILFDIHWKLASGKFPNNVVNFCDNTKLCTASWKSLASIIDSSPLDLQESCKQQN